MYVVLVGHVKQEFKHDDDDDDAVRQLTETELSREICLKLSETDTMWLLDMPSICVMGDSDEALEIVRQNSRYELVTDLFILDKM